MPDKDTVVIASVMRSSGTTGVQAHINALQAHLAATGRHGVVVTPFDAPALLWLPLLLMRRVIERFSPAFAVWWYRTGHGALLRMALRRELARLGRCSIYAQCPVSAAAALHARRSAAQRVVLVVHFNGSQADEWAGKGAIQVGGLAHRSILAFEQRVLPRVDGLVFVSAYMQALVTRRIPAVRHVAQAVIPNFVRDPLADGAGMPPATSLSGDLIALGTLEPRKNQAYLLDILVEARSQGSCLTLTVVGDGPDRLALERRARELGLHGQVRFVGYVPFAARLIPQHRACIHVSREENLPVALIEAAAFGVPVFACPVGGVPEVFDDGHQGRTLPSDAPAGAASIVVNTLADEALMRSLGGAARQRFLERFESRQVAERLLAFLHEPVRPTTPARVLVVHNGYQQAGGEDAVVEAETSLLRERGHAVLELRRHNDELKEIGALSALQQTLWSRRSYADVATALREYRPDVVHVHNTFPLVSPSMYWACASAGVPVVQTLHNFRLACPQAMFLRDGKSCESCLSRLPLPAVRHRCYRGSRAQSAAVAAMLSVHRGLGTWRRKVTRYIALNEFCREKFRAAGLPPARLTLKPNFVDAAACTHGPRSGFLFVGRMSEEKGIATLAHAWREPELPRLTGIGDGPQVALLQGVPGVTLLGTQPAAVVRSHMERAMALVLPSVCYESMPRTLVEAFAAGLPVIASRAGPLAELVDEGQTGLLFAPGDVDGLRRCVAWAAAHPDEMATMGQRARSVYEERYTADRNYGLLSGIYDEARREAATARAGRRRLARERLPAESAIPARGRLG